jgi:hypothetical protein
MFQTKIVQKTKTYIFHPTIFFQKPRLFLDNVKNIEPDRSKMQNNTMPEKMRSACRITEARIETHTHTHNISYLRLFHGNNAYANAPQCYVISRLPILLIFTLGVTYKPSYLNIELNECLSCYFNKYRSFLMLRIVLTRRSSQPLMVKKYVHNLCSKYAAISPFYITSS